MPLAAMCVQCVCTTAPVAATAAAYTWAETLLPLDWVLAVGVRGQHLVGDGLDSLVLKTEVEVYLVLGRNRDAQVL